MDGDAVCDNAHSVKGHQLQRAADKTNEIAWKEFDLFAASYLDKRALFSTSSSVKVAERSYGAVIFLRLLQARK
jgi:hypothetical protein